MSASNPVARRRTSLALVVTAATLGALLAVPAVSSAASAAPKCFGQPATIVGTAGDDVLKGTPRADVIVAKGGHDVIDGRGGKDRICAGTGNDKVRGGYGADWVSGGWGNDWLGGYKGDDKLFGNQGQDRVLGGDGNDRLNGGLGTDRCVQAAGTGPVQNCEVADLAVTVSSPNNSRVPGVTFTVTVTNNGPNAATYMLNLAQSSQKATCAPVDWAGTHAGELLASGASRAMTVDTSCTKDRGGAKVMVDAKVSSLASDPDTLNNAVQGKTNLK